MKKITSVVASICLLSSQVFGGPYTVKSNETLTQILKHKKLYPIYGPNGYLERTLQANTQLQKDKGNIIFPGDQIQIPEEFDTQQIVNDEQKNRVAEKQAEPVVNAPTPKVPQSVELGLGTNFLKIDTSDKLTGGTAQIVTDMNWLAHVKWLFKTSDSWAHFVKARYQSYTFKKSKTGVGLSGQSGGLMSFGLGSLYTADSLRLTAGLDYGQLLFVRTLNSNTLGIEAEYAFQPYFAADYAFYKMTFVDIGVDAEIKAVLPGTQGAYEMQLGHSFSGALFARKTLNKKYMQSLAFRMGGQVQKNDTQLQKQEQSTVFTEVILGWDF